MQLTHHVPSLCASRAGAEWVTKRGEDQPGDARCGETLAGWLADTESCENFDARPYVNEKGFAFVGIQQLVIEHLMGARG